MLRKIIVVGDPPSSGGAVLANANSTFSVGDAGHKAALIGGSVRCDGCNSTGIIAKAGGPRRIQFMGEVALENDIVVCKCPQPPKLIATLHHTMNYDDLIESLGSVPPPGASDGSAIVGKLFRGATCDAHTFDEAVHLSQEVPASALAGLPFFIETEDGQQLSGNLDDQGRMPRVATDHLGSYEIFWGEEALAKG